MLLRLDSLAARCLFAEVQELAYAVPELGKPPKTEFRHIATGWIGEVVVLTHGRRPF